MLSLWPGRLPRLPQNASLQASAGGTSLAISIHPQSIASSSPRGLVGSAQLSPGMTMLSLKLPQFTWMPVDVVYGIHGG